MIVLIGFMGAGKTTVGRLVAAKLGLPFADSDQVIEQRTGRQIRRIFAEDGEPAFRDLEHSVIAALLASQDTVLALGGGAPSHPVTRSLLAGLPVVYLRVSFAEAMSRVGDDKGRPMLARPDIRSLHAQREPLYASIATLTIDTDPLSPPDIALKVLEGLRLAWIVLLAGAWKPIHALRYCSRDHDRRGMHAGRDDARLQRRLQPGGKRARRLRARRA